MKICWDNIENITLSAHGNFRYKGMTYIEMDSCECCGLPYLTEKARASKFCTRSCSLKGENAPWFGKKLSKYHKNKVLKTLIPNKPTYGPCYNTFAAQISMCEAVRRNPSDKNYLEVKCTYCGRWYQPDIIDVKCRIEVLKGQRQGEARLYCSDNCKKACPIYGQVLWPKGFKLATSREVQPELRQLVLNRDVYKCTKCGKGIKEVELHCHHITGILQNPIESADIDNCITLCKKHHILVHRNKGCGYNDLKCNT